MANVLNRSSSQQIKPHAVVFPYPAHGHINPMMQLSKKLASEGFVVTVVCTEYRCKQILEAQAQPGDLSSVEEGLLDIRVEGLSDGLPACFDRENPSIELAKAFNNLGGVFEELMQRLCRQEPLVTCLISDSFLPWTQAIASKWRIPRVFFWTQSVAVYTIFANTHRLISNGLNPFKENLNTATGIITYIPGIPPLPATCLPYRTRVVGGEDRRPLLSQSLEQQFGQLNEAVWIIANSFSELESQALLALEVEAAPEIHLLGPLLPATCLDGTSPLHNAMDCECLQWLDTQAVSSVLYISFGTVATLSTTQVAEVAMGLIAIQQPFLWVIRSEKLSEMLPEGFLDSTKEQGMVIKWANQPLVLAHPAVGGFVTHCGWNSTLESISMGVPMLTWPHFLDQFTNSWFVVNEWKIGVELKRREDGMVEKGEVERAARLLMQEQEGKEVRARAERLRDAARKAVQMDGGTSERNLQLFVQDMMDRATKG